MSLRTGNKPAAIRECSIRERVIGEQAVHVVVLEGKKCGRENLLALLKSCPFTEAFTTLLFIGRCANTPLPSNVVENAASDM
ncbi:hypothetical protein [Alteromonas genovensis]|uniref:hypothetical protein n=1 Tax=Alteromonas genovensis TaxID=471225 RepID=UPI002FDFF299